MTQNDCFSNEKVIYKALSKTKYGVLLRNKIKDNIKSKELLTLLGVLSKRELQFKIKGRENHETFYKAEYTDIDIIFIINHTITF